MACQIMGTRTSEEWLTAPFVLDLIEARAYGDGAVLHVYRPPVPMSAPA